MHTNSEIGAVRLSVIFKIGESNDSNKSTHMKVSSVDYIKAEREKFDVMD